MRIQPRRQIVDIWRSVIRASFQEGTWVWGGRDDRNSISDAEQLLCLLYPATELTNLALDRPDDMAEDVAKALEPLGDPSTIPQRLVDVLVDYITFYTDDRGQPNFAGGSYVRTASYAGGPDASGTESLTEDQREIGVVDSYSMSVTLCLAALGFLAVFKPLTLLRRKPTLTERVDELEHAFSKRLTCAMIGLLRSFVVNTVGSSDPAHAVMLKMMNQNDALDEVVLDNLRNRLARVRARLLDDVRIGVAGEVGLSEEARLFECGWGWGIVRNSANVPVVLGDSGFDEQPVITKQEGVADPRPYLYSTVVALDGINDLRSQRTRELGLLNDEQRRLNEALQLRGDLTQRYWGTIARFGDQKWPLEDIPWQTSDSEESDYFSLLVSAVLVQDLQNREATDDDLNRLVLIFEALAQRGRITRRVMQQDASVAMHVPGVQMRLGGSERMGQQLFWSVADFAPLLLKRAVQSARLSANVDARDQLMRLAEAAMDHLLLRKISQGPASGLWDDPSKVLFPHGERKPQDKPSWYLTERVVEALVAAARTFADPPLRSTQVKSRALDLLHEADHLLNQEMLESGADETPVRQAELSSIEATLARARRLLVRQPGTANALANEALRRLDQLTVAHLDAIRSI
ncbi:MAG: SCO2524 family protein [Labedaea sp.]